MPPGKALLLSRCHELRKNATDAEQLLWSILRNRQAASFKFRRQYVFGNYILDFYCPEVKLAIEVDGGQHVNQAAYDRTREEVLASNGIKVLRFWNNEILVNLEAVVEMVWKELEARPSWS